MRSLQLLRTPFLCGLLWACCASGTRAEQPAAGSSHHGSMGLDKHTVHDQEYVFSQRCGWVPPPLSCGGTRSPLFLLTFFKDAMDSLYPPVSQVFLFFVIISPVEDLEAQMG